MTGEAHAFTCWVHLRFPRYAATRCVNADALLRSMWRQGVRL
jgi:hypothetical protein